MSKDETGNGGLFSKVVKFVRNPATNWADLDQKEADRESTYTKQALKEMIERKRRNDFVRKREFDMLRKMRRREAMSGTPGSMHTRSPGFRLYTSAPTSTTTPAASWPSTIGDLTMKEPIRPWV